MEARRQVKSDIIGFLRENWLIEQGLYQNYASIPLARTILPDGNTVVYRNDSYFNWVYYTDIVGPTYPPVISDDTGVISSANYRVHYQFGEITFPSYTPTGIVTANFAALYYAVTESDDNLFDLKDYKLSYIVPTRVVCREAGLQLGGGHWQFWDITLELGSYHRTSIAKARARTDDLVELLKKNFRVTSIPLIDYDTNLPLTANGDRVTAYDRDTQNNGYYSVTENEIVDMEIPNYEDEREIARHSLSFTIAGTADASTT